MTAKTALKKFDAGNGKKGKANSIDRQVGLQLRKQRCLQGLSQSQLADQLGITFQQIQKYENGANRLSCSRLYEIGYILSIPVSTFFDDIEDKDFESYEDDGQLQPQRPESSKETIALLKMYYSIQSPTLRKEFLTFTKRLVSSLKKD